MFQYIYDGNLQGVKCALNRGISIETKLTYSILKDIKYIDRCTYEVTNLCTHFGQTPLMIALITKKADIVEFLLDNKADIEAKADDGYTMLMASSSGGFVQFAKMIIKQGFDVNAKTTTNCDNLTALISAVQSNSTDMVKLLLDNKADIEILSYCIFTPLILATMNNNIGMIRLLLDRGADINATDYEGGTALMSASRDGYIDIAKLLLDRVLIPK